MDKLRKPIILQFMLAIILSFLSPAALASNSGDLHVLILHPFTPNDPAHEEFNKGLIRALGQHPQYTFSYSYEYFDYARRPNRQNRDDQLF